VLVVGLVGSRSPPEELLDRGGAPGGSVSVVVLDLVVVPGDQPGKGSVRRPPSEASSFLDFRPRSTPDESP
jgi:hypothetical protein